MISSYVPFLIAVSYLAGIPRDDIVNAAKKVQLQPGSADFIRRCIDSGMFKFYFFDLPQLLVEDASLNAPLS